MTQALELGVPAVDSWMPGCCEAQSPADVGLMYVHPKLAQLVSGSLKATDAAMAAGGGIGDGGGGDEAYVGQASGCVMAAVYVQMGPSTMDVSAGTAPHVTARTTWRGMQGGPRRLGWASAVCAMAAAAAGYASALQARWAPTRRWGAARAWRYMPAVLPAVLPAVQKSPSNLRPPAQGGRDVASSGRSPAAARAHAGPAQRHGGAGHMRARSTCWWPS